MFLKSSKPSKSLFDKNHEQPAQQHLRAQNECVATVNSRYSGHPRDRHLVSVIARVRYSEVRENSYFKPYLTVGGHMCVQHLFQTRCRTKTQRQNFIYKQNRRYTPLVYNSSSKYVNNNNRINVHKCIVLVSYCTVLKYSNQHF